ncbi:hypothetical protein ACH347_29885 [Saccharopolyspora sp. 5N102]|uniref:hypothetical protein n=1 Tax=Saccharopolyspora sp. 5N102 TaxID=3375155 RepID=UPI0037A86A88
MLHGSLLKARRTWNLQCMCAPTAWLFPGRTPDRPLSEGVLRKHFRNHGIVLASRDSARTALAAELPTAVLANLTDIDVNTALRRNRW